MLYIFLNKRARSFHIGGPGGNRFVMGRGETGVAYSCAKHPLYKLFLTSEKVCCILMYFAIGVFQFYPPISDKAK